MRSLLRKIGESLEGSVSLDIEALTEQFTVLTEDHARVAPEVWEKAARAINRRERLRLRYQRFDGVRRAYLVEPCHLLRLQTSGRKELTRWVLSWMPDVTVLAPAELKARVVARLQEGLAGLAG